MNREFSAEAIDVRGAFDGTLLDELVHAICAVQPVVESLAATVGVRLPSTRWLISGDFANDVMQELGSSGPTFTTGRLGGDVAAKTLRNRLGTGHVIALNGALLLNPHDRCGLADHVFLAAHELTHVLQQEVRRQSGVMEGVPVPSETIRQSWRSVARIVGDEYRADRIAAAAVKQVASVSDSDGITRPAGIADTWVLNHLAGMEALALSLHPALPDLVQSYREWTIPLDALVRRLVIYTEQVATALAHWQATCDELDVVDSWALGDFDQGPATSLYLKPLWEPICRCLHEQSLIPLINSRLESRNSSQPARRPSKRSGALSA